ncbi:hypothetical protein [Desulfonatronovibrio magnus]|uniref:hypothetical protein n=1 Tax=Desulfonatronovibrio magnus TaxID=698827 RepID=UPI0005EBC451|nr:hypothetical protein [Desulfonatronovibrio magnus]
MDPSGLIPVADTIPTHWGWFYFFLLLTFILHLLLMNVMLGSGIISLVKHIRKGGSASCPVCKDISLKLPYKIAFTINFGVAPLLFLQVLYGQFIYVSSIMMAVYWLSVVGILVIMYYSAYIYDFKYDQWPNLRIYFVGLMVALALIIAFFFSNNMTLMLSPEKWTGFFDNRSGTMLNLSDPTLIPRYLHFVVASIAVGGLFMAITWKFKQSPKAAEYIEEGMKWFSYATLAQIVIGIWFLISLPQDIMLLFMGGKALNTAIFLLGLSGVAMILVFSFKKMVWATTAGLVMTIIFMVLMRDMVRSAYLGGYYHPSERVVVPEYAPLFIFLVVFVIGIGAVFYMLKLAFEAGKEA